MNKLPPAEMMRQQIVDWGNRNGFPVTRRQLTRKHVGLRPLRVAFAEVQRNRIPAIFQVLFPKLFSAPPAARLSYDDAGVPWPGSVVNVEPRGIKLRARDIFSQCAHCFGWLRPDEVDGHCPYCEAQT